MLSIVLECCIDVFNNYKRRGTLFPAHKLSDGLTPTPPPADVVAPNV